MYTYVHVCACVRVCVCVCVHTGMLADHIGHQAWGVQHDNTSQALPDMGDGGSLAGVSIHSQGNAMCSALE